MWYKKWYFFWKHSIYAVCWLNSCYPHSILSSFVTLCDRAFFVLKALCLVGLLNIHMFCHVMSYYVQKHLKMVQMWYKMWYFLWYSKALCLVASEVVLVWFILIFCKIFFCFGFCILCCFIYETFNHFFFNAVSVLIYYIWVTFDMIVCKK